MSLTQSYLAVAISYPVFYSEIKKKFRILVSELFDKVISQVCHFIEKEKYYHIY